jgi:hypothetical protein
VRLVWARHPPGPRTARGEFDLKTERPVAVKPDPVLPGVHRHHGGDFIAARAAGKKGATTPSPSATDSTRVDAAGGSAWHHVRHIAAPSPIRSFDSRMPSLSGSVYVPFLVAPNPRSGKCNIRTIAQFASPRGVRLPDRPVPLDVAILAVEDEGQHAAVPAGPPLTAPLDLVTPESVPPGEVVQSGGTGGGAHR